jgi:hypothetical protein
VESCHFRSESASIDRLLERGELQSAYTTAQRLLDRCLSEGEDAYDNADYDIAMTYIRLGRVLGRSGNAHAALDPLIQAELKRAIECDKPFGHAAEPWKTWELLNRLETA